MIEKHLKINWDKVLISPELRWIFEFLMRIDNEVSYQINFNSKLQWISERVMKLLKDLWESCKLLKENNIDFSYSLTKLDLENIASDFDKTNFICSQMICLFAYMETISCIMTVYHSETEITDEQLLIEKCNDDLEDFIKKYILNDKNVYYKKNISRFSWMWAKNLIKTRNALTHFYSVWNRIWIIPKWLINYYKKIKKISNWYNYISPEDFYWLLEWSFKIILNERNNDCLNDKKTFNEKITYVTNLISKNAAVEMEFTNEMLKNI